MQRIPGALAFGQMEDNGLEPPVEPPEKPSSVPVYAINPTRAQFTKIFEAIQDSFSAEQLAELTQLGKTLTETAPTSS
jgi:hypothetical protein